jgi:hypothetical protein
MVHPIDKPMINRSCLLLSVDLLAYSIQKPSDFRSDAKLGRVLLISRQSTVVANILYFILL